MNGMDKRRVDSGTNMWDEMDSLIGSGDVCISSKLRKNYHGDLLTSYIIAKSFTSSWSVSYVHADVHPGRDIFCDCQPDH